MSSIEDINECGEYFSDAERDAFKWKTEVLQYLHKIHSEYSTLSMTPFDNARLAGEKNMLKAMIKFIDYNL